MELTDNMCITDLLLSRPTRREQMLKPRTKHLSDTQSQCLNKPP